MSGGYAKSLGFQKEAPPSPTSGNKALLSCASGLCLPRTRLVLKRACRALRVILRALDCGLWQGASCPPTETRRSDTVTENTQHGHLNKRQTLGGDSSHTAPLPLKVN